MIPHRLFSFVYTLYIFFISFFFQIVNSIESILRALPKITRSTSEPLLHRAKPNEIDVSYPCPTPHTPIQGQNVFSFLPSQPQAAY